MVAKQYNISLEQIEVIRHALGSGHSTDTEKWGWRNYFHAGEEDVPLLMSLVEQGLMVRPRDLYFMVTEEGMKFVGMSEFRIKTCGTVPKQLAS